MLEGFFFGKHLDEDEKMHVTVHKYWFMGVKVLWLPTVCFIFAWTLLYFIPDRHVFYGVLVMTIAIAVWWAHNFMDFYLDTWIITSKGIIDLQWHGWFHRTASRVLYSDIEAVDYEIKGIWQTVLNVGTVGVEKISTGSNISMEYIKKPKQVASLISELSEQYIHAKNLKDAKTVQNILAEFIAGNMQMKEFEEETEEDEEETESDDEESDDE